MHNHGSAPDSNARRPLVIALAITATVLVAEVIGGILTGSLALLADAAHMATDVAALALFASWVTGRVVTPDPAPGACSLDTPLGRDACLAQPTVPAHHHAH